MHRYEVMNNMMGFGALGGEGACTVTDVFAAGPRTVQFTTSYELVMQGAPRVVCMPAPRQCMVKLSSKMRSAFFLNNNG
jgi:hypothetical protein